jgi:4-methyl-5(b-hydroxyethyl)-thiazole monophosphate biosynthesis
MARVLVVLAPGAEEIETVTVADVLVRAGCEVLVAHTAEEVVAGSRGIRLAGHLPLDQVLDQDFDLVYLPGGGDSAACCRDDARIQDLAQRQLASGRLLAVICACPIPLVPRALAHDRVVTSYPAVRDTVEPAVREWRDQAVVIDGNLITSQGPGTAMALALTLARLLAGEDTAADVAAGLLTQLPAAV